MLFYLRIQRSQFIILVFFFIYGTNGYLNPQANEPSKENILFPSTTSGKASSILREILNQESLVRFSMVQKIQSLVMDVLDSKNNTEILKKKLIHLAKELSVLKTKNGRLEQNDIELKQELSTIDNRISDNQNINIQSLNESEISFLRSQFSAIEKDNEERDLKFSKIKEKLKVDMRNLKNETFALKQQYVTLSKEKDALESKLHKMEKGINSSNIDARLKLIENTFQNFSHSVAEALHDIRKDQNANSMRLLNVSSQLQPACGAGWNLFDDRCYWFSTNTASLHEAVTECIRKKSVLVEPNAIAEENWLRLQSSIRGYNNIWIGVTDLLHEGIFVFNSNGLRTQDVYSHWYSGQPNGQKAENCVILTSSYYGWHDYPCSDKFYYVCKTRPN